MLFLLATLLLNLLLFVLFKLFPRFGVNRATAILINYLVCFVLGWVFTGGLQASTLLQPWLPFAVGIGSLFIFLFNLLARSTSELGMGPTTIANKLSLIIPAIAGVFLFQETLHWGEILGFVLAFPALSLSLPRGSKLSKNPSWFLPAIIFLGSGLLDTLLAYTSHHFLAETPSFYRFSLVAFGTAAALGMMHKIASKRSLDWILDGRSLAAGVLLGLPNYFSIYFLVQLLQSGWIEKSAALPINNIGIVLFSGLLGRFLFQEPAYKKQNLGLLLAALSILWISLSDLYG